MSAKSKVVIAALGIVALLIAAFVYVLGAHLPSRETEPAALLPPGWQFYPRPTTLEPPGTVFRIDENRRRYIVDTLDVPIETGAEAFGRHTQSIRTTANILAGILGDATNISMSESGAGTMELEFELVDVERETTADISVIPKIQGLAEQLLRVQETLDELWPDFEALRRTPPKTRDRLYVIRESISALEIHYSLSTKVLASLGGETTLTELAKTRADLEYERRDGFVLRQKFPQRMRVMFLAERIMASIPLAAKPKPPRIVYETHPVFEPLVWKEAPDTR